MATDIESSETLRQELKIWEKNFTADHGGRKPSRDDIRANTTIRNKYKQYDQFCRPAAPKPSMPQTSTPRKESKTQHLAQEPLQTRHPNAQTSTPRKPTNTQSATTSHLSPVKEPEPEPAPEPTPSFIRSALGPTPQKDGHVLGIFDLLSSGATPPKPAPSHPNPADKIFATPSKPTTASPAISRTPQSSSKRFYLDAFAGTPLAQKRQRLTSPGLADQSPARSKVEDATPSFLRRSFPLAGLENETTGPPRRPPIRKSLSSVIRAMKAQESQRMDDEMDVLDEIEAEARGAAPPPQKKPTPRINGAEAGDMPLGPDRGMEESEDDEAEPLGRGGQPRKPWKKKGLKRQTRRVNMRPVLHAPRKAAELEAVQEEDEDEGAGEEDVVLETRLDGATATASTKHGKHDDGSGDETEYYDEDSGDENETPASPSATRKSKPRPNPVPEKKPADKGTAKGKEKEKERPAENVLKKAGKKVAATAHANFRRLNIKNKNSKAKGRGRFGRR